MFGRSKWNSIKSDFQYADVSLSIRAGTALMMGHCWRLFFFFLSRSLHSTLSFIKGAKKWLTYFLDSFQLNCALLLATIGWFSIETPNHCTIDSGTGTGDGGVCVNLCAFIVCVCVFFLFSWQRIREKKLRVKLVFWVNLRWN